MLERLGQLADPIGAIVGFVLTLMVLSYIIGDNLLFRLAISIFVGAASGYAVVLVLYNVFWHQLLVPILQAATTGGVDLAGYAIRVAPAILLGAWMLTKLSARTARLGTPVLAFLTGVGAATVIAGAVQGTIFPQVGASANMLNTQFAPSQMSELVGWFINGLVVLVGTITTLIYFHFGMKRPEEGSPVQRPVILDYLSTAGQAFITITLGVLFAGVYIAALSALVDRVQFLWEIITRFF